MNPHKRPHAMAATGQSGRAWRRCLMATALVLLAAGQAQAQATSYTFSILPAIGGDWSYSDATTVNNAGQVAGYSLVAGFDFHATLWNHGKAIDLGTLGGAGDGQRRLRHQRCGPGGGVVHRRHEHPACRSMEPGLA
jgi:probable HAF family extracellular repeat protein